MRKIERAQALPDDIRRRVLAALDTFPTGDRICHGDFHPGNILMTVRGEVVIDWIDVTRGNPLADLARTTILALGAAATDRGLASLVGLLHGHLPLGPRYFPPEQVTEVQERFLAAELVRDRYGSADWTART